MVSYKDIEQIGSGGNGVVWKVENDRNEIFAKKTIKHFNKKIAYKRFRDEIEVIKNNPHPGIIEIVDSYIPESGSSNKNPYYIMPLGVPLKDELEILNIAQTLDLIVKIIDTIEFLHDNKITHRDIKIENILIVENYPKLSDFGLANFPKQERVSKLNEKIGPAYTIAPEMKRVSSSAEYKKADVYSLAKTIWVILTKNLMSFDGQYSSNSSIGLGNYLELKINKGPNIDRIDFFSVVILEQLLHDATHNDPDKRPTIKEFKEKFSFWIKSNSDYKLRNGIEWQDAIKKIFPISVPDYCVWDKIYEIKSVLDILFTSYDMLNHTFFPTSGGLDLISVDLVVIESKRYLMVNNHYLFVPKVLYFESMNHFDWSYFRLEVETNRPFFDLNNTRNEEYLFLDENLNVFKDEIEDGEAYTFIHSGSLLIVQKISKINKLSGELDHYGGIHNKMDNSEYKMLIKKVKAYSNTYLNKNEN
ncbi:protein kinase domain-containing protein [Elizabethkingia anophelis]|uniref:protein kinase domain-containing protein n=1 Tax=Elizabethkingia anophelis TaxID=1117645 RepID=UPI003891D0AE